CAFGAARIRSSLCRGPARWFASGRTLASKWSNARNSSSTKKPPPRSPRGCARSSPNTSTRRLRAPRTADHAMTDTMYPALLRYWRNARGMSQLDLAAAADVSPKHVSFLETGRSTPSREMVLRLASTLGLPLRDQNAMLTAAGFSPAFADVDAARHDPAIQRALATMMKKHEPYPMLVFDRNYDIVQVNAAAQRMLKLLLGPRAGEERNIMRLIFDPGLL